MNIEIEENQPIPLGSGLAKKWIKLAITLNCPRSKRFLSLTSEEQKRAYRSMFMKLVEYKIEFLDEMEYDYEFEYCKTGQIHLHGWISYGTTKVLSLAGLVSDTVKRYLRMPMIRQVYREKAYFPTLQRYRSASICVQICDDEYFDHWKNYMIKERRLHWDEVLKHALEDGNQPQAGGPLTIQEKIACGLIVEDGYSEDNSE